MDRPLLLIAASGLAKEVIALVRDHGGHHLVGILDDELSLHGTSFAGLGVLGPLTLATDYPEAQFVVCAGRGASRRSIVERLVPWGITEDRFATVVDASVRVPESCTVGRGTILLAGTVLTADVAVGRHVVSMPHVTLTHDDQIADFVTLCAGVSLGGSVHISTGAYLGMNASVRERVTVGERAVVGMGAVVLDDVEADLTVVGNPARPLGARHLEPTRVTDRTIDGGS